MEENRGILFALGRGGRGRVVGMIVGLVVGLLVTVLGFLKSLILVLFVIVGYFVGRYYDEEIALKEHKKDEKSGSLSDSV